MVLIYLLAVAVVAIAIVVYYINKIQTLSNQIDKAYAEIENNLQRRADLIPQLVNTVKGFVKHEEKVFGDIAAARAAMMKATDMNAKLAAHDKMNNYLKGLLAIAENYPELKTSPNFMQLQEELSNTENRISYARSFYNDAVMQYNNIITTIPGMWFAGGRKPKEFFKASEEAKKAPKVEF